MKFCSNAFSPNINTSGDHKVTGKFEPEELP
jgi:hypothetical protein